MIKNKEILPIVKQPSIWFSAFFFLVPFCINDIMQVHKSSSSSSESSSSSDSCESQELIGIETMKDVWKRRKMEHDKMINTFFNRRYLLTIEFLAAPTVNLEALPITYSVCCVSWIIWQTL